MPSTTDFPVRLHRDGAVACIEFNRPDALNALDVPSALAFQAAVSQVSADDSVRAVVIRGAGRAFGVGGDLTAMRDDAPAVAMQLIDALHDAVLRLAALNAPVIASVQGVVAGGSLSLALACDLVMAAEGTRFNLAYAGVGASCDVSGSWQLPRRVGLARAMEIALLAETLDATEALRIGLINRVVPAAELAGATDALARRLAAGPTQAYGRIKRLLRQSFDTDLATQLDAEREAFAASTTTADFQEGLAAFLAKRPPVFRGR
jgi:2-(1,2-epoxy-1,2-dihydrophenyl)acetyl-CoA isomerase